MASSCGHVMLRKSRHNMGKITDSSLPSLCAAALSWCSSSWLSSHRRRGRCASGSFIHNWMSSLCPLGGGGGRGWTYASFLFRGLRPELFHDGDELQQSGQANNRIGRSCLYRGIIGGYSPRHWRWHTPLPPPTPLYLAADRGFPP